MPRNGMRGTKRDDNHVAYATAVRAAGFAWADTYALGSGFGDGVMSVKVDPGLASPSLTVEVKGPRGKPTEAEIKWRKENPDMPYLVSKHPAEAIRAFARFFHPAEIELMVQIATKAYEELMR